MASASKNVYAAASSSYPYTMSVSWSESNANVANNTSVISASGSFDGQYIGFNAYGGYNYYLRLYWHDNRTNNDTLFASSAAFSSAGYQNGGGKSVSGSITVTHNNDGGLSGYVRLRFESPSTSGGYAPGTTDLSTSWTGLTTIARASSITGVSGSQLGSGVSVTIDRKSSSFTHKVEYDFAGSGYTTVTTSAATSASFTPPVSLSSKVPNSTSGVLTVRVTTYNGSTQIGNSVTWAINLSVPSSVVPSISSVSASRVDNSVPSGWGIYVKGKSQVKVTINGASGSYGSSISSYYISGPSLTSSSSSATSGTLWSSGTLTYTCTVTDSRGRSASKSVSISVVDYYSPSISVTANRCTSDGTESADGTYLKCVVTFSYASVSSKNSISSKSCSCNSVSNTSFSSDTAFILSANCLIGSQYTLSASVTDALGETASANVVIPTAYRIMNVNKAKTSIAFGKFAVSGGGMFEVNMKDAYFYGNINGTEGLGVQGEGYIGKALQIGHVKREGYEIRNANGTLTWLKLGTMYGSSDDMNTIVKIYSGAGYNAGTNQNTELDIFIKDGWQSTASKTNAFGATYSMPYNVDNGVKVKIISWSDSVFDIYVYLPWTYYNLYYTIEYRRGGRWDHQGTRTESTSEPSPSNGVSQPVKNMTPDLKGYPVGAVYITYNNNNPGNFLGGTWERFGQGRTLVGEGSGNDGSTSTTFTAGSSGGEYKHKLSEGELASHSHKFPYMPSSNEVGGYGLVNGQVGFAGRPIVTGDYNSSKRCTTTTSTGSNTGHNNIQPYITVYFWKRTA